MRLLLAAMLGLFALETVSVVVVVEGPDVSGLAISATAPGLEVGGVTDRTGRAALELPPDTPVTVRVNGHAFGTVRTPPPEYTSKIALQWPPEFTLRFVRLPPVGARAGVNPAPVLAPRFRVVAIGSDHEPRKVAPDAGETIVVDWMFPGESFDVYIAEGPGNSWFWYAGPFEIEANAEITIRVNPGGRIRLDPVVFTTGTAQFDSARRDEIRRVLNVLSSQIERFLGNQPGTTLEIEGHTDDRGNDASNLELSMRRAEAVRTYLIRRGVPAERIFARGYGEALPVAPNDSNAGRLRNRRVEMSFRRPGG